MEALYLHLTYNVMCSDFQKNGKSWNRVDSLKRH